MLRLTNVEVRYDRVILVLKGLSLEVPEGHIVALLGANGAGKSTTLKAISGLLKSDDGQVTDGSIEFDGRDTTHLDPADIVQRGMFQVMEGRRVFEHLSVEENLLAGGHSRRGDLGSTVETVYSYFPRLKQRRAGLAGYLSGGEQQMLAIGRALMAQPRLIMLDEPSLGLAPLIVHEIFEIIQRINRQSGTTILLVEQNARLAMQSGQLCLPHGKRPRRARGHTGQAAREPGCPGVLPGSDRARSTPQLPRRQALQAQKTVALMNPSHWLSGLVAHAYAHAPAVRAILDSAGVEPDDVRSLEDLEQVPITHKDALIDLQELSPPFGGFLGVPQTQLARVFLSPGPLFDPQGLEPTTGALARHYARPAFSAARSCSTRARTT